MREEINAYKEMMAESSINEAKINKEKLDKVIAGLKKAGEKADKKFWNSLDPIVNWLMDHDILPPSAG